MKGGATKRVARHRVRVLGYIILTSTQYATNERLLWIRQRRVLSGAGDIEGNVQRIETKTPAHVQSVQDLSLGFSMLSAPSCISPAARTRSMVACVHILRLGPRKPNASVSQRRSRPKLSGNHVSRNGIRIVLRVSHIQ